jgi:hypothetical protein
MDGHSGPSGHAGAVAVKGVDKSTMPVFQLIMAVTSILVAIRCGAVAAILPTGLLSAFGLAAGQG